MLVDGKVNNNGQSRIPVDSTSPDSAPLSFSVNVRGIGGVGHGGFRVRRDAGYPSEIQRRSSRSDEPEAGMRRKGLG